MQFIFIGGLSFAAATWLSRSIVRALLCVFAALGVSAGVFTVLLALGAGVPARLYIEWGWFAFAWWAIVLLCAVAFRWMRPASEYGVVELVGCWVAILTGLRMAIRIDFSHDLLTFLVHVEDNAAWVGLTTQVTSNAAIGSGIGYLGPVIPTMLGLLHEFQRTSLPLYNSTFAAYALAVLVTPVVAAGLLRQVRSRHPMVLVACALLLIAWVYQVPLLLFSNYGHLSAIWAFLFLIAMVSWGAFDAPHPRTLLVSSGLLIALGASWFPLAPLALILVVLIAARTWPGQTTRGRIAILGMSGVVAWCLYKQLKDVVGAGASDGVAQLESALTPLYAAQGGTAAIDPTLFFGALVGFVALAFLVPRSDQQVAPLWKAALVLLAYLGLVFAGSYYLKVGVGYGPTKVAFICGFAVVVLLLAVAMRQPMPSQAVVALVAVVFVGSLIYGGTGALLARSWPGPGSNPIWLAPIERVATSDAAAHRAIGCFSKETFNTYMCTRWASAMTLAGDGPFLGYRLSVINAGDSAGVVKGLQESGVLKDTDLVVLDLPDEAHPWGWTLIQNAGRVYGLDGKLLDPRPVAPAGQ